MPRLSFVSLSILLVLSAFSSSACSGNSGEKVADSGKAGAPAEVHVKLTEYKVEMDKTTIPAGPVKFIIENAGKITHEVVLESGGAKDEPMKVGEKESEV